MPIGHHPDVGLRQARFRLRPGLLVVDEPKQVFAPGAFRKVTVVEDEGLAVAPYIALRVQLHQHGVGRKVDGLQGLQERPDVKTTVLAEDKLRFGEIPAHHLRDALGLVHIRHHKV